MAIRTNATVADEVRGIAAKRRVRQTEIADALHISRMGISRRLNGTTPFTAGELITLADFFDVRVGEFFGEHFAITEGAA